MLFEISKTIISHRIRQKMSFNMRSFCDELPRPSSIKVATIHIVNEQQRPKLGLTDHEIWRADLTDQCLH